MMDFRTLSRSNCRRADELEGEEDAIAKHTPFHWALGLCSEAGEVADVFVKALREERSICHRHLSDELADVVIYADLLAQRMNIDLGAAVVSKFNRDSVRFGSGTRIPDPAAEQQADDDTEVPTDG